MSLAAAAPAQGGPQIPTLSEPSESESGTGNATPRTAADGDEKKKKRGLFGFGKKKAEEPTKSSSKPPSLVSNSNSNSTAPTKTRPPTTSPIQTDHAHFSPASPGRAGFASSPRLASPAGSQIFERDVQESLVPTSPAIPSHIQTENHIPPVLDASSEAITDDHLDPDSVEIITHASHQPASVAVTGVGVGISGLSPYYEPPLSSLSASSSHWADELAAFSAQRTTATTSGPTTNTTTTTTTTTNADTASNYGSFDTTDVRRLSFISFADVVQSEQLPFPGSAQAGSRESMHLAGLTSLSAVGINRSPSPIRSPVSSAGGGGGDARIGGGVSGGGSPPTSTSGSVRGGVGGGGRGGEASPSPSRRGERGAPPLGSPTSVVSMSLHPAGPTVSGEIAIETMTQALRRTGSGDLTAGGSSGGGGVRSFPTSPI